MARISISVPAIARRQPDVLPPGYWKALVGRKRQFVRAALFEAGCQLPPHVQLWSAVNT